MTRRKLIRRCLLALAVPVVLVLVWWLFCPRPELYPTGTTWSRQVRDRDGALLQLTLTADDKYRLFVPLQEQSPHLIEATLFHEDRRFRAHPGVNVLSLGRAVWGVVTRSRLGGGSTLTMQHARLRWRLDTRGPGGKLVQIARALQLERHYSKDEILEACLNIAPYGGNVEGAGAASLLWCGKKPAELTRREAVSLSLIPQSPARRCPVPAGNPALTAASARLLAALQLKNGEAADPFDAGFSLRPPVPPPRLAPHFSRRVLGETGTPVVASTLSLPQQRLVEAAISDFVVHHRELGLKNAAVVLVHAPTREVRAYAGSADFFNETIQGQVDGVQAPRSPGSTLKPFIYALAMDQGLIHPASLVIDAPRSYGGYNPENADREFCGPLSATQALVRSRNLPAVELASQLRGEGLYGFLHQAGVVLPKPAEHYGLSLALGGADVTLEQLAGLYALLAIDGVPRPLRTIANAAEPTEAAPLLSPAALFLTRTMLMTEAHPGISFKTGTSHGHRDAWAVGIHGEWVLAVWVGNFRGGTGAHYLARETAAPLLFQTLACLGLPEPGAQAPPATVRQVDLCAVSGQLPGAHCRHLSRGWFIPGVSPIAPCGIHQEILIDPASGLRVAHDDGRPGLRREIQECWPPQLLSLFRAAGLPRREPPRFESTAVVASTSGPPPRIASPQPGLTYTLRAGDLAKSSLPLRADPAPGVRTLHWFAGAVSLGSTSALQPLLWQAPPGHWTLRCLDDQGRSATCLVRVERE